MKISLNNLKRYVKFDCTYQELVDILINLGIEVENVEVKSEKYEKFKIGYVIEKKKHPNADKLSLCRVDVGSGRMLNIVCGAPNVDKGQKVCVALEGAVIPESGLVIRKSKIRGEISEGMICSSRELGLGEDQEGILVLDTALKPGSDFAQHLNLDDIIFEIGITPNRGDLLSYTGIAREISAALGVTLEIPEIRETFRHQHGTDIEILVENYQACPRYCGLVMRNVKISESPVWLKEFLSASGFRPVNNVVDITNFVMLESGQPLHAFDLDKISGNRIIVRSSAGNEKFVTLDGKERVLNENILLICDAEKPLALAGIMGGINSEITESTVNIFLESAYFDPVVTRRASKYLGLQTDSSYRFERGADIDHTDRAIRRAAELIEQIAGGSADSPVIDIYPIRISKNEIKLRVQTIKKITGVEINADETVEILSRLGISLKTRKGDNLIFEIPNYRREDLKREIDLVEEVIRLYGYDKIRELQQDRISLDIRDFNNTRYDSYNRYRRYLIDNGFSEIITSPFVDENDVKLFSGNYVSLINPHGRSAGVLRPNLIIGALHTVRSNLNHGSKFLKLFESGSVFYYSDDAITENRNKLLVMAGEYLPGVLEKTRPVDIFDIRAELEALLRKFNIEINNLIDYYYNSNYDFQMDYFKDDILVASVYKPSNALLNHFDINKSVVLCEIY